MSTIDALTAAIIANPDDETARLALADAITEALSAPVGFAGYHPEMGESRPLGHIEARMSFSGRHYYLHTFLALRGRGIEFRSRSANGRRNGMNEYKVTLNAYAKLEKRYVIVQEVLL